MVNCGWSPRDMADPLKHMLDRSRNVEAEQLPEVKEIILDEAENEIEVVFETTLNEIGLGLFNDLVKKEAGLNTGVRFGAIKSVERNQEGDGVVIKMIAPDVPTLKQVRPEHYVSCLIYDVEGWDRKVIHA